jgi:hypothetical protein
MRSEREDVYQRMVSAGILDRNTKSDWNGEPTAKPLLRVRACRLDLRV